MAEEKDKQAIDEIHREYYDDEINLFDYILVLWKWKWLISVGTLLVVIAALVITLQMPKSYVVSMALEPGITGVDKLGDKQYMDSKEIINEINGGKYNRTITKSLSEPPLHSPLVFTAQAEKYDNLIIVKSQWTKSDLDTGLEASGKLGSLLIKDHEERIGKQEKEISALIETEHEKIEKAKETMQDTVDKRKKQASALIETEHEKIEKAKKTMQDTVDKSVRSYSSQINVLQEKTALNKQVFEATKCRQEELAEDLRKSTNALEEMIAQRDSLLRDSKNTGSEFLPEYEIAIRNWQLHIGQTEDKIFSAKVKNLGLLSKIRMMDLEIQSHRQMVKDVETEQSHQLQELTKSVRKETERHREAIKDFEVKQNDQLQEKTKILEEKIEKLSATRASISNIKIIRQPEAASTSVKSTRGKKIVMLSGVAALFMLIFLAFLLEYIKNARREYLSRKEQT